MDFSPHKYPKANFFVMVQNFRWLITQKHFFLFACKYKQDSREKYTLPPTLLPSKFIRGGGGLRLNVCRKELGAQNKKSKHICGNQGTAAFLHTNQLISVWNKMIFPRQKKKKWLSSSNSSHPYPMDSEMCSTSRSTPELMRGNWWLTVLTAQLHVLRVTGLCRSWGKLLR